MAQGKARKGRFNLFGYGAIALYVSLLVVAAAGVYGFNLTSLLLALRTSELTRDQMRTGHMVITTDDRTTCRSVRFNNQTSELSKETAMDCDDAKADIGGSFNLFRNGFRNR